MDLRDSTWAAFDGGDRQNPREQARVGLEYIRARYGEPRDKFWDRPGWYDPRDDSEG